MLETGDLLSLGRLSQVLVVLSAGLATSLTPCVYPLIPITISLFGATSAQSKLRAFFLALCYVMGIALTYTALGIFTALSGVLFGSFLGNPWVVLALVGFFVVLALFTLDMLQLSFIYRFQTKASQVGGKGALGAFLMGSVSGIVAGPCVGPILAIILGFAAQTKDVVWGGALLFFYSLGLGVPFLVLGTFSGLISKLPKAGSWLSCIKFVTAAALLVVALRLAWPFIPKSSEISLTLALPYFSIVLALCLAGGFLAYKLDYSWLKLLSAGLIACAFSPAISFEQPAIKLVWEANLDQGLATAKAQQKFVMLDIAAEWCAACKELDHKTFSNTEVATRLSQLELIRLDFTVMEDEQNKVAERLGIQGLPSVLFFNRNGEEIQDSRVTGFMEPKEFLAHLNKYLR